MGLLSSVKECYEVTPRADQMTEPEEASSGNSNVNGTFGFNKETLQRKRKQKDSDLICVRKIKS